MRAAQRAIEFPTAIAYREASLYRGCKTTIAFVCLERKPSRNSWKGTPASTRDGAAAMGGEQSHRVAALGQKTLHRRTSKKVVRTRLNDLRTISPSTGKNSMGAGYSGDGGAA